LKLFYAPAKARSDYSPEVRIAPVSDGVLGRRAVSLTLPDGADEPDFTAVAVPMLAVGIRMPSGE